MDVKREKRLEFIQSLSGVIENATSRAETLLQTLGWSKERILDEKGDANLLACPFDKDHRVGSKGFEAHTKMCALQNAGFSNVPLKNLPESSEFFYKSPMSSVNQVNIGKEQLEAIGICFNRQNVTVKNGITGTPQAPRMPSSSGAEFCLPASYLETMLNAEDRLKLYEYVVLVGKTEKKGKTVNFDDLEKDALEQQKILEMQDKLEEDRPRSKVEALAELRDYKRRRQSYRAKNPALSKTSATMVIRELIDQQMKYLEIVSHDQANVSGSQQDEIDFDGLNKADNEGNDDVCRSVVSPTVSSQSASDRNDKTDGYKRGRGYERERGEADRHRRRGSRDRWFKQESSERYGKGDERGESRQMERWRRRDGDRVRERYRGREREWERTRDNDHTGTRYRERSPLIRETVKVETTELKGANMSEKDAELDVVAREDLVENKEDQDVERWKEEQNGASGSERRNRKSRKRSTSRSQSESREKHKHKRRKEKKKKKKHKREREQGRADEGEERSGGSLDEWIERG